MSLPDEVGIGYNFYFVKKGQKKPCKSRAGLYVFIVGAEGAEINSVREFINKLTPREHEIMTYVISGMLNKQIAYELDISEETVKIHRGRVMQKLEIVSVAELVRFCEKAGIAPAEQSK